MHWKEESFCQVQTVSKSFSLSTGNWPGQRNAWKLLHFWEGRTSYLVVVRLTDGWDISQQSSLFLSRKLKTFVFARLFLKTLKIPNPQAADIWSQRHDRLPYSNRAEQIRWSSDFKASCLWGITSCIVSPQVLRPHGRPPTTTATQQHPPHSSEVPNAMPQARLCFSK